MGVQRGRHRQCQDRLGPRDAGRSGIAPIFSGSQGLALEWGRVSSEIGTMSPASWLTAKRVRVHGLLLAAGLWTVYAVNMSTPGLLDRSGLVKGTDFLHF